VPADAQDVFVLAFVHGRQADEIAAALGCGDDDAARRREDVHRLMREIGESGAFRPAAPAG
jgi:DNA-directed RNA polymerase specialized sigma24 family protein